MDANRSTSGASTSTKSQTPGSTFLRSSRFTPFDVDASGQFNENRAEAPGFDNLDGTQSADEVDASLSLDEFFRRYTSEDNESFSRILEKINKALAGTDRKELMRKLPKFIYDEEKALERTRQILTEKIAQLNSAIDDVSAQLRADDAPNGAAVSPDELEASV